MKNVRRITLTAIPVQMRETATRSDGENVKSTNAPGGDRRSCVERASHTEILPLGPVGSVPVDVDKSIRSIDCKYLGNA